MKKRKIPHQKRNGDASPPRRFSIGRIAYMAFLCPTVSLMFSQPAFAATDVWTKATEIMQDVYTQILAISTIAAIVTASVALLLMNFSRSGKTVDESRAWLKRIVITWAILNSLGFIMSYTITVLASPEQARIITELENDGVAHVALISRNNDQLAEELLAEQDKTLQEIYFPETLVDENADAQSSEPAAEGDAENTEGGEPETVSPESGQEDSK